MLVSLAIGPTITRNAWLKNIKETLATEGYSTFPLSEKDAKEFFSNLWEKDGKKASERKALDAWFDSFDGCVEDLTAGVCLCYILHKGYEYVGIGLTSKKPQESPAQGAFLFPLFTEWA